MWCAMHHTTWDKRSHEIKGLFKHEKEDQVSSHGICR